jgi:hypothetical protein
MKMILVSVSVSLCPNKPPKQIQTEQSRWSSTFVALACLLAFKLSQDWQNPRSILVLNLFSFFEILFLKASKGVYLF